MYTIKTRKGNEVSTHNTIQAARAELVRLNDVSMRPGYYIQHPAPVLPLTVLAQRCRALVERADAARIELDDGNVVDLCADHLPASLSDIRRALVVAGLAPRFPRATRASV